MTPTPIATTRHPPERTDGSLYWARKTDGGWTAVRYTEKTDPARFDLWSVAPIQVAA